MSTLNVFEGAVESQRRNAIYTCTSTPFQTPSTPSLGRHRVFTARVFTPEGSNLHPQRIQES